MSFKYFSIVVLALCFISTGSLAQTAPFKYANDGLKKGTLASQFEHLNYISRSQDTYKLIRKENLDIIKTNVQDSISRLQNEIKTFKTNTGDHAAVQQNLRDSIQQLRVALSTEKTQTDSINVLGMPIQKTLYNTIVWSLIGALLLIAIIALVLYRKAKVDTLEYQKTAELSQEEYNVLRKKSLEKEQALRRQLQDELNRRSSE